ncbi:MULTISPECIES: hypothetical protein [unclassified Duganella]|uniref:hypothetical protein n=1 Tax=unclassified Duganella TaxID=2636909 RepID=UPI0006FEF613|nr:MULTISPECIES: hypothetical protein [unclassified Duganella]KQV59308.1 hypothetical protein ASD07_24105 [Duganella sp. Root336D2]
MSINDKEVAENEALKDALKALQRDRELCKQAGYGSIVLGLLFDAQCETQYAPNTRLGRN